MIGKSYIAPMWAFGYEQSRWGYKNEQDIKPNTIRLSIGAEHIDDIIADLENGFAAVKE